MLLIRAIVRPEKSGVVLKALIDAGFPGTTKMSVFGRGKQRGLKVGNITYDELPKELLLIAIKDADKDYVVNIIMQAARTEGKGAFGDGKIFITPIVESYTISSGLKEVEEKPVVEN